jgi:hypothetical protein
MNTAFYTFDGGRFIASELTRGPWSNQHQHGGPPCALLGRTLASFGADAAEFSLARITVELLRPVPIAPLTVRCELVRPGKSVHRLEAVLLCDDSEVARASGLRIRRREFPLPEAGASSAAPLVAAPESLASFTFPFFRHELGYHRAVDVRFASGQWGDRSVVVWSRPTVELVAGEPLTAVERTLIIVDAESGICPPLDPQRASFVNPDLTVYFERELRGDWLGLSVRSAAHSHGVGIAESLLFDEGGPVGRSVQSLVLGAR